MKISTYVLVLTCLGMITGLLPTINLEASGESTLTDKLHGMVRLGDINSGVPLEKIKIRIWCQNGEDTRTVETGEGGYYDVFSLHESHKYNIWANGWWNYDHIEAFDPRYTVDIHDDVELTIDDADGYHIENFKLDLVSNDDNEEKENDDNNIALTNDAKIVNENIPNTILTGKKVSISLTVKNKGTSTWTYDENYRLGSLIGNNFLWSDFENGGYSNSREDNRAYLGANDAISPTSQKTFKFSITAPAYAGIYTFKVQMVRDGFEWFGSVFTKSITVTSPIEDSNNDIKKEGNNNAKIIDYNIPDKMHTSETTSISITFGNTGTTTWKRADNYRLGSLEGNNLGWSNFKDGGYSNNAGDNRAYLSINDAIPPNNRKTFEFGLNAPTSPGTYLFKAQMVRDGFEWFGIVFAKSINVEYKHESEVEEKTKTNKLHGMVRLSDINSGVPLEKIKIRIWCQNGDDTRTVETGEGGYYDVFGLHESHKYNIWANGWWNYDHIEAFDARYTVDIHDNVELTIDDADGYHIENFKLELRNSNNNDNSDDSTKLIDKNFFGIGGGGEPIGNDAETMQDLGIGMYRMEFITDGAEDYTNYWNIVNSASSHGVTILGLIDYQTVEYGKRDMNLLENRKNFVEKTKKIVNNFKNNIKYWEIWNEQNFIEEVLITPENYGLLITDVYKAIKSIDPEAKVIIGGIFTGIQIDQGWSFKSKHPNGIYNGDGSEIEYHGSYGADEISGDAVPAANFGGPRYLYAIYSSESVKDYYNENKKYPFDGIGLHPYGGDWDPNYFLNTLLNEFGKVIEHFNDKNKLWLTEVGYAIGHLGDMPSQDEPENYQADFLEKTLSIVTAHPKVESIIWFCYKDWSEEGWGIIRSDGSKKPAFDRYKNFIKGKTVNLYMVDSEEKKNSDNNSGESNNNAIEEVSNSYTDSSTIVNEKNDYSNTIATQNFGIAIILIPSVIFLIIISYCVRTATQRKITMMKSQKLKQKEIKLITKKMPKIVRCYTPMDK
ncbi:MAG: hypothetical protein AB1779_02905 [Candidatus Thermoplasmatota archaeon]